jgi:5-formyltetrahydrofolate cyclo-ligase
VVIVGGGDVMGEKDTWRKSMKEALSKMEKKRYAEWSKQIHSSLFAAEEWKQSNTIGITISRFPEVETKGIIEQAWSEGKRVAVPKCYPIEKSMKFRLLENFDQLETVYFGLKEPEVSKTSVCKKEEIELMLVPGLVFDLRGYRIGFGGGYYDRYLAEFSGRKVSLAFSEQVQELVPNDEYDLPVHKIITNEAEYVSTAGE